jgi:hypothetical protein
MARRNGAPFFPSLKYDFPFLKTARRDEATALPIWD